MPFSKRAITLTSALVLGSIVSLDRCWAEITYAKRGWFCATVRVEGKAANATLTVEVSTESLDDSPGPFVFQSTGYEITTDANGNGSVTISNSDPTGRLRRRHIVRVVSDDGTGNFAIVEAKRLWDVIQSGAPGGPSGTIRLEQGFQDGNLIDLLESWEPCAVFTVRLNANEASFVDLGASLSTEGDLVAQLLQITSQEVRIGIVADPTSTSLDDILLSGIGVVVQPGIDEIHPSLSLFGNQLIFVQNSPVQTLTGDGTQFVEQTLISVTPSEPVFVLGWCGVDSFFDIADPIALLSYLFPNGNAATPACLDSCDANNDGALDIADAIGMLLALFGGGPSIGSTCGPDPDFPPGSVGCNMSNCP